MSQIKIEQVLLEADAVLERAGLAIYEEACELRDEAHEIIRHVRKRGGRTGSLGVSIRSRAKLWGPRIVWVRVDTAGKENGKNRSTIAHDPGSSQRTREIPLHSGRSVKRRIFQNLTDPLPERLNEIEDRFSEMRAAIQHARQFKNFLKTLAKTDGDGTAP